MSDDPYAAHAMLLVYGEDRVDIVRQLREYADRIERGGDGCFREMPGAEGLCMVRDSTRPGAGEEAGACRLYVVYGDGEGWTPSDVIAMFADKDTAERFVAGKQLYDEDDGPPGGDLGILRADVVLSVWNSFDPDPHKGDTG